MPARTVNFVQNGYYHIYNRGSEKRTIFQAPRDYINFLDRVKDKSIKFNIDILSYCLMPNHFHFLLRQSSDISLVNFLNAIQLGHAKYFNTKYSRVGPLFQGRFKAKLIETEEYLLQLSAYIHRNPIANFIDSGNPSDSRNRIHVRDMLCNNPYSSYRTYIKLESQPFVKNDIILSYFSKTNPKLSYKSFVENFIPDIEALNPLLAAYD